MNFYLTTRRSFLLLFFLTSSFVGQAQSDLGAWYMFFNQNRLSQHWSFSTEAQFRNYTIEPNLEQLLLRGNLNYYLNNNTTASIGYARVLNYGFNKDINDKSIVQENRIWQQGIFKNTLGRFFFEHRLRLEQRFINKAISSTYKNRFRYLIRASVPLNREVLVDKTLYLSFYNEIFLQSEGNVFDRNRLYGSLGYQFNKQLNIQLGIMEQSLSSISRTYLQAAIFYNLDFRK